MDEIDEGSATTLEIVTATIIGIETEKETGIGTGTGTGIGIETIATTVNIVTRKGEGHLPLC
jgi:hypothetical protein